MAAEPMHQYEVTEVNWPFRCFSLYVRCINTRAITLYSRILFHSQRSHLHMCPHFINRDHFQHTWQRGENKIERVKGRTQTQGLCILSGYFRGGAIYNLN